MRCYSSTPRRGADHSSRGVFIEVCPSPLLQQRSSPSWCQNPRSFLTKYRGSSCSNGLRLPGVKTPGRSWPNTAHFFFHPQSHSPHSNGLCLPSVKTPGRSWPNTAGSSSSISSSTSLSSQNQRQLSKRSSPRGPSQSRFALDLPPQPRLRTHCLRIINITFQAAETARSVSVAYC